MTEAVCLRRRLLFPKTCLLNFNEKMVWTVRLAMEYSDFKPVFKEGQGLQQPYITVGTEEAVKHLTTDGFQNIVMVVPEEGIFTKVILFKYPTYLDPDHLLYNDSVVWVKRNIVHYKKQSQVIALIKGEAPKKIFVQGLGYRKVSKYQEKPKLCLKCYYWGHLVLKCQYDPRCKYCGNKHDSKECTKKQKFPFCCNCRGKHTPWSYLCPMNPINAVAGGWYSAS